MLLYFSYLDCSIFSKLINVFNAFVTLLLSGNLLLLKVNTFKLEYVPLQLWAALL